MILSDIFIECHSLFTKEIYVEARLDSTQLHIILAVLTTCWFNLSMWNKKKYIDFVISSNFYVSPLLSWIIYNKKLLNYQCNSIDVEKRYRFSRLI